MQRSPGATGDAAMQPRVLAHYRLVGSYIAAHLEGTPIVFRNYPDGNLDGDGVFHVTHVPLSVDKLLWFIDLSSP